MPGRDFSQSQLMSTLRESREPLIAVAIAAAVLGVLLWPGLLIFPETLEHGSRGSVPGSLDNDPRNSQPAHIAPGGASPPSGALLNRGDQPPGTNARLAQILDSSVVSITGNTPDGAQHSGSGFFVAPDRVVTNRHVVDNLVPNSIRLGGKAVGSDVSAHVIAQTPAGQILLEVQDFALLTADKPGRGFLSLGPSPAKLAAIVAAGYPENLADKDPVLVQGIVNQKPESLQVKVLTHSANVGAGGGGGPLIDSCGRVVGVNTATNDLNTSFFAQDVSELQQFLVINGVKVNLDDSPCETPAANVRN